MFFNVVWSVSVRYRPEDLTLIEVYGGYSSPGGFNKWEALWSAGPRPSFSSPPDVVHVRKFRVVFKAEDGWIC